MKNYRVLCAIGLTGGALALSCANPGADPDEAAGETMATAATQASAVLLVSGDFASGSKTKSIVQGELASDPSAKLLAVGDMAYAPTKPNGTNYDENFPWAGWESRTYPVMGNHEFVSFSGNGGQQPFALFNGKNAANDHTFAAIKGDNGVETYDFTYSTEVAPGWLLVALNSGTNCAQQDCQAQANNLSKWVAAYRSAHANKGCVMLALHTARFSTMFSDDADNYPWAAGVDPIWKAAVASKVDIVLQGHVHVYEEFEKLDATGTKYSGTGAKLFTVGAGGRGQVKGSKYPDSNISSSLLVASHASPIDGILKLGLYAGSYGYHFETAASGGAPASSKACNVP